MFDWIFGGKKEKEQETKPLQHWVYGFVRDYLVSPIWSVPLLDLIQSNCFLFEDGEVNKFEYTKVFQEFVGLAALLLQSMLEQTGITERQFEECMRKGLAHPKDNKIFKQLLVCDNFQTFKKLMVSKNKEIESEAMRSMVGEESALQKLEQDKHQIQTAIAMSMALKGKVQEEKEMEEAIRESLRSYEEDNKKKEELRQKEKIHQKQYQKEISTLPPIVISTKSHYDRPIQENLIEQKKILAEIEKIKISIEKQQKVMEKEGEEERKKRLQEQRQLIMKKKQQGRKEQLSHFVESKPENKLNEQELQRRKKIMQKLKQQLKQ